MTAVVVESVVEQLLRDLLSAPAAEPLDWAVPGLLPAPGPDPSIAVAREAVAALVARSASGRPVDVAALFSLSEQLQGLALRELAEMDASGRVAETGAVSTSTWLREELLLTDDAARAQVRLASALRDDVPQVDELLCDGATTLEHARAVVAGTRGLDRTVLADAQPAIVALVATTDPATVRTQLRERAEAIHPELGQEAERRAHARRGITASAHATGVSVGGGFGVEDGQQFLHGLDLAVEADRADGDPRSLPQRRADVLVQWARDAAARLAPGASGEAEDLRTARTHLLITCTAEQVVLLAGGSLAQTVTGGWPYVGQPAGGSYGPGVLVTPDAVRRLACDAVLSLAVTTGSAGLAASTGAAGAVQPATPSVGPLGDLRPAPTPDPLHLGRAARLVTGRQWRALVLRDRRCVVKGCRRRPAQCQAHHVQHWLDGGLTDLPNLVLLCHQHHHDHHDRGLDLPHRDGQRWLTQTGWANSPP